MTLSIHSLIHLFIHLFIHFLLSYLALNRSQEERRENLVAIIMILHWYLPVALKPLVERLGSTNTDLMVIVPMDLFCIELVAWAKEAVARTIWGIQTTAIAAIGHNSLYLIQSSPLQWLI
jgi:hypothetical protein